MEEFIRLMAFPFLACLLLAGIHVYLGIHVIARKVIFVDLALAQIAALGGVFGVLLGYDFHHDPWAVKFYSLAFALVGATVFSFTRTRNERVPHEAIIGITYAVALAATILATANLPHGSEDVRQLLSGNILWVRGETIVSTAILYAVIGLLLTANHRRLLRISTDADRAHEEGVRVRLWDFVFYALFGFVVTSSVAIAGVLLVFSFLVIPAVIGVLFADGVRARLAIGWICGTLVSFAGVTVSYFGDLPSGPTIVVLFGAVLAITAALQQIYRAPQRGAAALRVFGGCLLIAGFAFTAWTLRKVEREDPLHQLESPVANERLLIVETARLNDAMWQDLRQSLRVALDDSNPDVRATAVELAVEREAVDWIADIHALLEDSDDHVRESALRAVRHFRSESSREPVIEALEIELDEYLRIDLAHALLELGDARGLPPLVEQMDVSPVPQVRKEAWETLRAHTEPPVAFDVRAGADTPENDASIELLTQWIESEPHIEPH